MITKAQSLDNFIDKSLYEKNKGYYQRKVEFGRRGDFITVSYTHLTLPTM